MCNKEEDYEDQTTSPGGTGGGETYSGEQIELDFQIDVPEGPIDVPGQPGDPGPTGLPGWN